MLRTFFIASLAAASVLASSIAAGEGISPKKRPLKSAADATAHVTQPLIAAATNSVRAQPMLVVA
jgi:hypothetical protein